MAEVPFRPVRQLSEYKGKGASASRERKIEQDNCFIIQQIPIAYHFQNEKNYGSMIKTLKASKTELQEIEVYYRSHFT